MKYMYCNNKKNLKIAKTKPLRFKHLQQFGINSYEECLQRHKKSRENLVAVTKVLKNKVHC